jgi:hypothetical protein
MMNRYRFGWIALEGLAVFWLVLTACAITSTYPLRLFSLAILGPIVVASFSLLAVSTGNLEWSRFSLLTEAVLFSISLVSDTWLKNVSTNIPILLLTFVMLLFGVEFLNLVLSHHVQISNWLPDRTLKANAFMLSKSIGEIQNRLTQFGIVFAACYVLTIAVLFTSEIVVPLVPILSDIGVYVVLTSVSLALLVILKENQAVPR